ncbi:SAICAR synthase-like protein [Atractiella rhizophila]|nr:SAICAR synthase-like protein [Atractiella rhizophila]
MEADVRRASVEEGREREKEKEREREKRRRSGSAGRRERREVEGREGEEQRVMVGNLIGEGHANYVLMYNMLTGIRIAVSRWQAKLKKPLVDEDYGACHKYSFDFIGNELTPSAKYDFKFKDYSPWVFRELRDHFRIDPADYLLSLTANYILSELGSPGKSGSFFYFSKDYRFIIKTIHHTEHKFLRKVLKEYHQHVLKNPHTLLSRFYGLHRVKLPRGRKIHFLVMNNLFPPHRDIHETYDLKGSAIGREYPEEKAAQKSGAVLKDLNWLHRGRHFELGPEKRMYFEEQLKRDTEFLKRLGIMDYSLLIGLHDLGRGNKENLRDGMLTVFQPDTVKVRRKPTMIQQASALRKAVHKADPKSLSDAKSGLPEQEGAERKHLIFYQDEGGFRATDGENKPLDTIYYLGIIDILTPYNSVKRIEHFFKGIQHDKHMISAVPPNEYGDRFLNFLTSFIRGADTSHRPKME